MCFQKLKRHFSRYTPEMVEKIAAFRPNLFHKVAHALAAASGPERTAAICYAVGWTQHSKGVQIIRAAAILQLLLETSNVIRVGISVEPVSVTRQGENSAARTPMFPSSNCKIAAARMI